MSFMKKLFGLLFIFLSIFDSRAYGGVEGSISGSVRDLQGVSVPQASVQLLNLNGKILNQLLTTVSGTFDFFPVLAGDYHLLIQAPGFQSDQISVSVQTGATSQVEIQLQPQPSSVKETLPEMKLEVKAKKHLIKSSSSSSRSEVTSQKIQDLPQGNEISLPKLITSTTPGAVPGAYGQIFFRGNHGNIQYQIDGVQLPDSPSGTFAQSFSPRNIERMEILTGGIPAEFGLRLGAVVNIITRSGAEEPNGEVQLNYGTYNSTSPHLLYGGSNPKGDLRYFFSFNFFRTDRGLDTPQPESPGNQRQGGADYIHDYGYGNTEFARVDWIADNTNKWSFTAFNTYVNYQIPNYPSSFPPNSNYFSEDYSGEFTGHSHDENDPSHTHTHSPTFVYYPPETNDSQNERTTYFQTNWKHTFSEKSFLVLAPYYKYSRIQAIGDPVHDLSSEQYLPGNPGNSPAATGPQSRGSTPIDYSNPTSVSLERNVHNVGLKGDYSIRAHEDHLIKTGFQFQATSATGYISVKRDLNSPPLSNSIPNIGYFESVYVQDNYRISKPLSVNFGLRFDATQFILGQDKPTDSALQPRIGLSYMATESTKLHAFYGRLFQPSALENLRVTFNQVNQTPSVYDVKAEKDNYYELGMNQQLGTTQVLSLTAYYKNGINILDDAQLLNTRISQPFNYAEGYGYGAEFSISGQLTPLWSEYANYSYTMAKGKGLSGGTFAAEPPNSADYIVLDHVQEHTANVGLTFKPNQLWWTTQALFGSGLRTGEANSKTLPHHLTFDTSVGFEFQGNSWWSKAKVSADLINIFNNRYPITIANEFNGTNYAAGRQFFVRLTKEL